MARLPKSISQKLQALVNAGQNTGIVRPGSGARAGEEIPVSTGGRRIRAKSLSSLSPATNTLLARGASGWAAYQSPPAEIRKRPIQLRRTKGTQETKNISVLFSVERSYGWDIFVDGEKKGEMLKEPMLPLYFRVTLGQAVGGGSEPALIEYEIEILSPLGFRISHSAAPAPTATSWAAPNFTFSTGVPLAEDSRLLTSAEGSIVSRYVVGGVEVSGGLANFVLNKRFDGFDDIGVLVNGTGSASATYPLELMSGGQGEVGGLVINTDLRGYEGNYITKFLSPPQGLLSLGSDGRAYPLCFSPAQILYGDTGYQAPFGPPPPPTFPEDEIREGPLYFNEAEVRGSDIKRQASNWRDWLATFFEPSPPGDPWDEYAENPGANVSGGKLHLVDLEQDIDGVPLREALKAREVEFEVDVLPDNEKKNRKLGRIDPASYGAQPEDVTILSIASV